MTTFILLRHGENDYYKKSRMAGRLPGVHLNARGRQQAEALAERLAPIPIKAIYSSPLERALETAAPLAERLGLPVSPRSGLIETDVGEWQGQSLKRLRRLKVWQLLQHSPSLFRFPGGETLVDGQQRIVNEIEALRQLHPGDETVVCVGHSDPIKHLLAYYLGMPLDLFQRLTVSTGSFSILQIGENVRLLALNCDPSQELPKFG
ncbi:MAG TPA: histidine phosphatase family protein [Anaerolineales bacterium]|nr:histidine phosphatase family protein [Anaerolineales bacterium]